MLKERSEGRGQEHSAEATKGLSLISHYLAKMLLRKRLYGS
uniref:Uncharacterized protein n=1 Tax=Manihot esculenta TaxID=3983 RepID=A0A2C9UK71_MANES